MGAGLTPAFRMFSTISIASCHSPACEQNAHIGTHVAQPPSYDCTAVHCSIDACTSNGTWRSVPLLVWLLMSVSGNPKQQYLSCRSRVESLGASEDPSPSAEVRQRRHLALHPSFLNVVGQQWHRSKRIKSGRASLLWPGWDSTPCTHAVYLPKWSGGSKLRRTPVKIRGELRIVCTR